jgi:hypothetical protein
MTIALLGLLAVWAATMVLALALCRTAAAGDRGMLDAQRAAALGADPEPRMPFANLEWAKGQRKRYRTTAAREPAAPSASGAPPASARQPTH